MNDNIREKERETERARVNRDIYYIFLLLPFQAIQTFQLLRLRCFGRTLEFLWSGTDTFLNIYRVQGEHMVELKIQVLLNLFRIALKSDPLCGFKVLPEILRSAARAVLWGMASIQHLVGTILGTLTAEMPQVGWVFIRLQHLFNFLSIFIWWG